MQLLTLVDAMCNAAPDTGRDPVPGLDAIPEGGGPPAPGPGAGAPTFSIADAERESGVPRATIRIWERRYAFPQPHRDGRGERCFTQEQVGLLRRMRVLVERGHRPGRLAGLAPDEWAALEESCLRAAPLPQQARHERFLRHLQRHDARALLRELEAALARQGLAAFVAGCVAPLNVAVGDAWAAGQVQVFEEHLYTDCIHQVLRQAIGRLPPGRPRMPTVLLATVPEERHGLGLLMAQALFAQEGCRTVSLGVSVPLQQVHAAAVAYKAGVVGLSFTAALNPAHVVRGLEQLRTMLPAATRLWAGGSAPVLARRALDGVRVMGDIAAIPQALKEDFAATSTARARS